MESSELKQQIVKAIDDAKGRNIRVMDVRGFSDVTDYMVIASGTSSRHVSSMADRVSESLRDQGAKPLGMEGRDTGEWVLIDFGDVIVHIMRPETRDFYNLEKLWGDLDAPAAAGSRDTPTVTG